MPQIAELTTEEDQQSIEFQEYRAWAAEPGNLIPFVTLSFAYFQGLVTIAEGKRIEHCKQVWQLAMSW
jgi:hypothetical protein